MRVLLVEDEPTAAHVLAKGLREQAYAVAYKDTILPHSYMADFVIMDKIILEVKAIACLTDSHLKQTLNYLAASRLKLGLLVNFGEDSLVWKRVIL